MVSGRNFDKFGVVDHTLDTKVPDFIAYLEKGKVMATMCKKCQTLYFPPKMDCPKCIASDMEWVELKGEGELVSYSIVNYGPVGFEDMAPYILGVARFAGGTQAFALLSKSIPQGDIEVGMKVRLVPVELANDRISYELQKI